MFNYELISYTASIITIFCFLYQLSLYFFIVKGLNSFGIFLKGRFRKNLRHLHLQTGLLILFSQLQYLGQNLELFGLEAKIKSQDFLPVLGGKES